MRFLDAETVQLRSARSPAEAPNPPAGDVLPSAAGRWAADASPATPEARPEIISVVAVEEKDELVEWIPEWEELAAAAIEPNVFYEPWQILPAVEAFGKQARLIHLLVFSAGPATPAARPTLIAYFPLERLRRFRGIPVQGLTLWKHTHCFLCTPLVRHGYAGQSLAALFSWARSDARGAAIVQFPEVAGDGLFVKELIDFAHERKRPAFIFGSHERALLVPHEDADRYLVASLPNKSRKQHRRLGRRIAEMGEVEFAALEPGGDLDAWVESFLRLEASGWKGRSDTALACHESERRFFTRMTREAHQRGRLEMLAMNLNGRPIAMKCNLLAGRGSFSFKIAFDEAYAHFSPGVLLEVENIRRLHASPELRWMDSCAAPNHPMANRLWIDRRTIQTVAVSSGRPMGDSFVRALPLMRWLKHRTARRRAVETVIGEQS